ncbi:helix-turn-helix domain-containing protein [Streptomyces sp. NPDC058335]|uniref:AraC-like ligand-binding domain-containing protein n=1 Tax=Streptomyces sp. NPDC058335 TaxID=3346451 RepID=UPI00365883D7
MLTVQKTTRDVSAAQRFEFWREAISDTFVDLNPTQAADDGRGFEGQIAGGQIGESRLCTVAARPHQVERSTGLIRRTGGDYLFVSLLVQGDIVYSQADRVAELTQPGQLVLYDSARPYRVAFRQDSKQVVARFPRDLLTRRLRNVEGVTALSIGGLNGIGALASGLLQSLAERVADVEAEVTAPLLDNALDVLTAALRWQSGSNADADEYQDLHRARARECIRKRHSDASLTPAAIAHEIGISERYLYLLFHAEGTSPVRLLMEERLTKAHAILTQRAPLTGTMESLALRLGFKQASHFSRAFKERYGLPPRQFREQSL